MRFVCDSCRAQYMISDEKVGPRGVKVRCKKCGYVILVRKPEVAAAPLPPPASTDDGVDATQVMQNPLSGAAPPPPDDPDVTHPGQPPSASNALAGVGDDEIGAVFDQVLQSGSHKIPAEASSGNGVNGNGASLGESPDDRMSTRVLDAEVIKKLADEAAQQEGTASNGTVSNGKNGHASTTITDHDWFVAIDDQQVGPLKLDKVKEYWDSGEIGPDSLCWRAGFSDWVALSEVSELASVLAPKPKQPVIVGTAPEPPLGSVVTVPVESAFTAGGVTHTVRSEVPVMTAAPAAGEDVGWKPSAASALASLVKEEIEALARPAPAAKKKPEPGKDEASPIRGLLDLPSQENPIPDNGATIQHPVDSGPPFSAAPSVPRGAPPVLSPGPALTPAPFGAAPYATSYKPAKQTSKALVYGGAAAALVILILIGLVAWMVILQQEKLEEIAQKPVQPVVVARAGPATAPQPAAAAPTTSTAPSTPAPEARKDEPKPEPVADAKKDEPARNEEPTCTAVAKKEEPPAERHTEHRSRPDREERRVAVRDDPPRRSEPEEVITPRHEEKSAPDVSTGDSADDFAAVFGGGSTSSKKADTTSDDRKGRRDSVYIPPPPGAVDIPERLTQSDIMTVVVGNKAAIKRCVDEQKKQNPGLTGRLVMSWVIRPSGTTTNIKVKTAEYKSTYMANCIAGLIKNWSFPKHKVQGEPIDFPFTF